MKSIEEIQRALDENKRQYSITQQKIREALSSEVVNRLTVSEHQEMLAPLYRESESAVILIVKYFCLSCGSDKTFGHPQTVRPISAPLPEV